ncbi:PilZ domain-containing protein [Sphingomonas glacialis]|uniref:PilZ domain-containing protein n=1 Tax=Sphingomonas glacialis TaxID=658225 RepID=UPI0016764AF6
MRNANRYRYTTGDEYPAHGGTRRAYQRAASRDYRAVRGDHARTHKVRDLSSGGVRVDQSDALRKGATVVITVGSLEAAPATVVWIADGWAGDLRNPYRR